MNNKNIIKTVLILLFVVVNTGCESDWFDEESSMQLSAEEQFETSDGFKDALIGAYLGMTAEELYAEDMTWNMVDLLSQQYAALPVQGVYSSIQQFNYESVRSSGQIEGIWSKAYNVIANIDLALEMTDKNRGVLGEIDYALIRGELLGLRAFLHFDLLRLFGHGNLENRQGLMGEYTIPYVKTFSKNVTPQRTYSDTFELLHEDLEEALGLLNSDPVYNEERPEDYFNDANREGFYDNREQRMNYYAVKGLQARVFQWEGEQQKAANAAEEVIQNSFAQLINSETYPVASDKIFYQELLFSLDIDAFADIINDQLTANTEASNNVNAVYYTSSYVRQIYETDSITIGLADVRFNTFMETQSKGVANIKLLQRNISTETFNQMPLIKLPEMYYIAAEANAKTGNLGKAIMYIEEVRKSRGILNNLSVNSTVEEILAEVRKEYQKEFLTEGQLFYYYKRTGETKIPGINNSNIIPDDDIYVLPYPDNEIEFGNR
ncbi:RagB/SusD family nutrient uptake outer membrane protein [Salinimicrobium sp. WS361]|uniref:RagB/SusD family nutrient uptake outer membrane protein n=1 Tax=Salinimicrobium sp. WS361 TaxID=3425123 RepID=UPI003D6E3F2C